MRTPWDDHFIPVRVIAPVGADAGERYPAALKRLYPGQVEGEYPNFVPAEPERTLPLLLEELKAALRDAGTVGS